MLLSPAWYQSWSQKKKKDTTWWCTTFFYDRKTAKIAYSSRNAQLRRCVRNASDCAQKASVGALYLQLKDAQSVTVALQNDSTSLSDTRIVFNKILKNFSELLDKLSTSEKLVEENTIESVLTKVQSGIEASLSARVKGSIKFLETFYTEINAASTSESITLTEKSLRKQKTETMSTKSSYKVSCFIVCTSYFCKRFL